MIANPKTGLIVGTVLGTLGLVALFAVMDPYLKFAALLFVVLGGYLVWSRGQ